MSLSEPHTCGELHGKVVWWWWTCTSYHIDPRSIPIYKIFIEHTGALRPGLEQNSSSSHATMQVMNMHARSSGHFINFLLMQTNPHTSSFTQPCPTNEYHLVYTLSCCIVYHPVSCFCVHAGIFITNIYKALLCSLHAL